MKIFNPLLKDCLKYTLFIINIAIAFSASAGLITVGNAGINVISGVGYNISGTTLHDAYVANGKHFDVSTGSESNEFSGRRSTIRPSDCSGYSGYSGWSGYYNTCQYVTEKTGIVQFGSMQASANASYSGDVGAMSSLDYKNSEDNYSAGAEAQVAEVFTVNGTANSTYQFMFDIILSGTVLTDVDSDINASGSGYLSVATQNMESQWINQGLINSNYITSYNGVNQINPSLDTQLRFDLTLDSSGVGKFWAISSVNTYVAESGSIDYHYDYYQHKWVDWGTSGNGFADFGHTLKSPLTIPDGVSVTASQGQWDIRTQQANSVPEPSSLSIFLLAILFIKIRLFDTNTKHKV